MNNFKFKHYAALYRVSQESNTYISNKTLTDEAAIAFLKEDPKRISLFSEYPENWRELAGYKDPAQLDLEEVIKEIEVEAQEVKTREDLMSMKMPDLKEMYPDIPITFGMKKKDMVDAIIEIELNKEA